ncbi:MAG: hypothetical protein FRX49_01147 [Trebouxia sp. A1-2]|nr:MAG: hypothetical protein FRX49_01147 [Trebouxia sp. A1-2]
MPEFTPDASVVVASFVNEDGQQEHDGLQNGIDVSMPDVLIPMTQAGRQARKHTRTEGGWSGLALGAATGSGRHLVPERLRAWLQRHQRAESAVAAWQQHWGAPPTADLSWLFQS